MEGPGLTWVHAGACGDEGRSWVSRTQVGVDIPCSALTTLGWGGAGVKGQTVPLSGGPTLPTGPGGAHGAVPEGEGGTGQGLP